MKVKDKAGKRQLVSGDGVHHPVALKQTRVYVVSGHQVDPGTTIVSQNIFKTARWRCRGFFYLLRSMDSTAKAKLSI
jgi:hypothetical protein